MRKEALLFLLGFAAIPVARAQSIQPTVLNAASGSATVSGNDVEWSVGEMTAVATVSNSGIVITQGFLQPAETPTNVASQQMITSHVQLYPNPADAFVIVQSNFPDAGKLKMVLTDVAGKVLLVQEAKVGGGIQKAEVPVANLAMGNYMLQLSYEGREQKGAASYKIQKIK
ncbi:T9SS type A sorting domain-containing protein [Taibaiella soli]|uniref:Secretion system C-terminal sorting domain-containing protein n=1 Tax=Taibaiella soli TaxID=1649169 RepID=A0A2W2AGE8_9BACT|nr:T9SS type A sorting domain-containing protein [Taibaiella soli]PZF71330.1 hypothetical protein DN068_18720 [Taibaiella soli]